MGRALSFTTAVLLSIASAGCHGGDAGNPPGQSPAVANVPPSVGLPGPFRVGIQLSNNQRDLEEGLFSTNFDFTDLRDLWVRVVVPGMPRMGMVTLVLIGPSMVRAYERNLMFTVDPGMTEMQMPGMDHPIQVFQAKPIKGGVAIDVPVPIAGSIISRYPTTNTGSWVAEVKIEGVPNTFVQGFEVTMGR
jgi:hypothetical protein